MSSSDYEYISIFRIFAQIRRSTIAARDSRSGIYKHECQRLSDDIGSAYDDDIFSCYFYTVVFE